MDPDTYGHLIFGIGAIPSSEKKTAFSTNVAGSTGGQHIEECKLIHSYIRRSSSSSGLMTST